MRASRVPLFNMLEQEQEDKGVDTFLQVMKEKLPKDKDEDGFL